MTSLVIRKAFIVYWYETALEIRQANTKGCYMHPGDYEHMQKSVVTLVVVTAVVAGMATIAVALQCQGKVIYMGQTKWEVQEACGGPVSIEEATEVVPQRVYDARQHVDTYIPVYVNKSIWTYNFGSNRLMYILTFREGKLDNIETGGYGH
jgi:multisubunit Na+/H+ antiporter MnhC subunit